MRAKRLMINVFMALFFALVLPFTLALFYTKQHAESLLREEISAKVVQNLQKSENGLNQVFSRMTNASNFFYWDETLLAAFSDEQTDYYQKYVAFNRVIRNMAAQNLYEYRTDNQDYTTDYFRITFFDRHNRVYASWSQNYQDYGYLGRQPWILESRAAQGFMVWNAASLGYAPGGKGAQPDQIALARTVRSNQPGAAAIGTLLVSIDQSRLIDILNAYKYQDSDLVFAASSRAGVLFTDRSHYADQGLEAIADKYRASAQGHGMVLLDGQRYLVTYYSVAKTRLANKDALKIFYLTDYRHLDTQITGVTLRITLICCLFCLLGGVLALLIARRITLPMRRLSAHMAAYRAGDQPVMLEAGRRDEIGDIYTAYYQMSEQIADLFARLRQETITREKYYYASLRSRMTPHFLFNTLNSIRWMAIMRGAENIQKSVDDLVVILRYSLENEDEMVSLHREIEVVKSYCHIQDVRFGNACRLDIDLSDALQTLPIIRFILQPAVENCFKHGFAPGRADCAIRVDGREEGGALRIAISDNGRGFSKDSIDAFERGRANREAAETESIGLRIVDERIRIAFGEDYGLTLQNLPDGGACVVYRLPILPEKGAVV